MSTGVCVGGTQTGPGPRRLYKLRNGCLLYRLIPRRNKEHWIYQMNKRGKAREKSVGRRGKEYGDDEEKRSNSGFLR